MENLKLTTNFNLDEFLDKVSYESLMKIATISQYIRDTTGLPCTINNWSSGGQYGFSGFRPVGCTVGSPTSEHRMMNAIDIKIAGMTGKEMLEWAEQHAKELYALGARRFEDSTLAVSWLHVDCREHGEKCIKIIDLVKVVKKIPV